MFNHPYELEHICSYNATVQQAEPIGPVAEGIRLNVYHTGGEVSGPRIRGKVRPVGGDWFTLRTDGVGVVDVRVTIETHDGALIYVTHVGHLDLGPNSYQATLDGQVPPDGIPFRTAARFQTAHPEDQWANRVICVGIGQVYLSVPEVRYDIYAVR